MDKVQQIISELRSRLDELEMAIGGGEDPEDAIDSGVDEDTEDSAPPRPPPPPPDSKSGRAKNLAIMLLGKKK